MIISIIHYLKINMNNKIEFTDNAKKEINRIISQEEFNKTYFRISVQGGGCSGFKYNFSFDEKFKRMTTFLTNYNR